MNGGNRNAGGSDATGRGPAGGVRADLAERAGAVSLLVLDVDGVLTDGSIWLDDAGREIKRFNARDGFGIKLWQRAGFPAAIITARTSESLRHRAAELGIEHVFQGASDKGAAFDLLAQRLGIEPGRIAYMGDDWPDLPALRRAGYPMTVADADPRVIAAAAYVTSRPGGHGAVREAVEHLLSIKGLLDGLRRQYDGG